MPQLQTETTPPGKDLRKILIRACFIIGLGGPALCWLTVLLGATRELFPHDRVATLAVTLSIYAPLLVFLNNKGERRPLNVQLIEFAWLVFFSNVGYQLFWEMPWFLLKETLMYQPITEADIWFWPFWAYGVADTRYLSHNDLIISISAMDGAVAMLEVACVYFFFKGYRVLAGWIALVLTVCMGWGQYYFYVSEIYRGFGGIEDGWFGLYIKYIFMGLPWLFFPVLATMGFMWHFATIYKKRGVDEYLARQKLQIGSSFVQETGVMQTTDDYGDLTPLPDIHGRMPLLIKLAFAWPFLFLAVDIFRFHT